MDSSPRFFFRRQRQVFTCLHLMICCMIVLFSGKFSRIETLVGERLRLQDKVQSLVKYSEFLFQQPPTGVFACGFEVFKSFQKTPVVGGSRCMLLGQGLIWACFQKNND